MEIVKFIGLLAMTWLFVTGAAPIQFLKKLARLHEDNPPKDLTRRVLLKLVNCYLCSGFWIGLTYYWATGHNSFILMACITSVSAELYSALINYLISKIRL